MKLQIILVALIIFLILILSSCSSYDTGFIDEKKYFALSEEECLTLDFICDVDEKMFFDDVGCGCEPSFKTYYCKSADRIVENCDDIYEPVCGYFDSAEIKCVREPCAQDYPNSCDACLDENIEYYKFGLCE